MIGAVIFLVPLHNEQNFPVLAGLCLEGYCAAQVRQYSVLKRDSLLVARGREDAKAAIVR